MNEKMVQEIREFLLKDFSPRYGELSYVFSENPLWEKLRSTGTELWLDTGSMKNANDLWTKEFTALTTNNTLLNHEVQQGTYDTLIRQAHSLLAKYDLTEDEEVLETAFILNAGHALRLVERFDAFVSVEEHTDLAHDAELAVEYGQRYYDICPERFIVKIPFTSAGLIATRRLSDRGIPVNLTLGFSARQNYLASRLARPAYVNVFLGRLNSFVSDNRLGSGEYVGEKAVLASQKVVKELRENSAIPTKQIGASFRNARQVVDLAGLDVMTMPPVVADSYRKLAPDKAIISNRTGEDYTPGISARDVERLRFDTLWNIPDKLIECVIGIEENHDLTSLQSQDLESLLAEAGCSDIFPCWTEEQKHTSMGEGKIPQVRNWQEYLEEKIIGLDSLMNLAGYSSFRADQIAMDHRIRGVLREVSTSA